MAREQNGLGWESFFGKTSSGYRIPSRPPVRGGIFVGLKRKERSSVNRKLPFKTTWATRTTNLVQRLLKGRFCTAHVWQQECMHARSHSEEVPFSLHACLSSRGLASCGLMRPTEELGWIRRCRLALTEVKSFTPRWKRHSFPFVLEGLLSDNQGLLKWKGEESHLTQPAGAGPLSPMKEHQLAGNQTRPIALLDGTIDDS